MKNMSEFCDNLSSLGVYGSLRLKLRKSDGSSELRKWDTMDFLPVGQGGKGSYPVTVVQEGETAIDTIEGMLTSLEPGLYDVIILSENTDGYLNVKRATGTRLLQTDGRLIAASGEAATSVVMESLFRTNTQLATSLAEQQKQSANLQKVSVETLAASLKAVQGVGETVMLLANKLTEFNQVQLRLAELIQDAERKSTHTPTIIDQVNEGVGDAVRGAAEQAANMIIGHVMAQAAQAVGGSGE